MPRQLPSYSAHRRWSVADARAALAGLAASGLSMAKFAVREGLDVERLRRWRRRLESVPVARATTFVELRQQAPESIEIVLRSGRVLRVAESVDPTALLRLIDALERSSC